MARRLGVQEFGAYATAVAYGSICVVFTDLNLATLVVRGYARGLDEAQVAYGNAMVVKAAAAMVVFAVSAVFAWVVTVPQQAFLMVLATATALVGGMGSLPVATFQAASRTTEMALWIVLTAVTTATVGIAAVMARGSSAAVLSSVLIANAILGAAVFVRSTRVVQPRFLPRRLRHAVKDWISFGLASISYILYFQADQVMLGVMAPGEAGVYAAAYRVAAFLYVIPGAVATMWYPRLFKVAGDRVEHRRLVGSYLAVSGAVGVTSAALVWSFTGWIVHILYGPGFSSAVRLLRVLVWFPALQSLSFPLGDALTTTGRQLQRTGVIVIAALFNVAGNLVVIPRAGAMGAAVITLITEGIILAAYAVLSGRASRHGSSGRRRRDDEGRE